MATGVASFTYTLLSSTNLEGKEYHAIGIDDTGRAALPNAIPFGGVAQIAEKVNRPMTIMKHGISIAMYGAEITAGTELTYHTDGTFVPKGILATPVVAIALVSGLAGELHSVLLV